jgi:PadR family transcriptional regulator, regulatory protein AphA
MIVHLVEKHGNTFLEGLATDCFLEREQHAVALVAACGEHSVHRVLLYAANFAESFFDLKSGLAGAILQKFANYHLKVALVIPSDFIQGKFKEFILETNRGNHFRAFHHKNDAEVWLTCD